MANGEPSQVEERDLTSTEERRPHLGGAALLGHLNGAPKKVNGAGEAVGPGDKQLFDIIETIPVMAWTMLPDGSNAFANRRWAEYCGLSAQDTVGSGWQAAIHPGDAEQYLHKSRESLATGEPFEGEARFRCAADGEYRWFLGRAVPLRDDQGNILRWYKILTDIEDRKRAEALLAGENRILEMVAKGESLPYILDCLCLLVEEHTRDALTAILLVEDGRLRHVGKPSLPPAYVEAVEGKIAVGPKVGSCGPAAYFARQVIVSDITTDPSFDELRDAVRLFPSLRAVWSTPIMSSEGKVIGTFAMYYSEPRSPSPRDQEIIEQITHLAGVAIQRAHLDRDLTVREAKIRRLVDANIIGIFIWEVEGGILEANDAFLRIMGYDREDLAAGRLRCTELMPQEWLEGDVQRGPEYVRTGRLHPFEKEFFRKDGSRVPVLIGLADFEESGRQGVAFVLDLTERKRAEDELRASEELKRRIIESSRDCIKVLDLDGNLLFMSSGGQRLLEIDNIQTYLNACWVDFWQPEDRPKISEAIAAARAGGIGKFQAFCPSAKGAPRWWDVITTPICNADGHPEQLLSVSRDITESKQAEAEAHEGERRYREVQMELAHANRVAAMGQLTASIAHEVKQPIAATVANARAALRFLDAPTVDLDEVRQILNDMLKDGNRAGEVVSRIQDLIKKAPPRRDRLNINEAIRELLELTRSAAVKNSVSIHAELANGLPIVHGDRVQLQQVLLNLIINAIEAMSGLGEGPRELLVSSGTIEPGGVLVRVRDSGPGLEPSMRDRVFESFYTTKPSGLGLGLSICRSIVEAHGGRLWASPTDPQGAVFQFTIPVVEGR
ncbi:PAS domain S-box protein [Bradyrhizobium sp. WSM3983]|uniref:PAS domain S-box protein n=1 Tax=Bradyrhizobium sp. WSM3983 TaxID=1038867 RepID=UPI00040870A6|nr:PAS domain S-box protein [Bradyrhizobium sp. WSM3983]